MKRCLSLFNDMNSFGEIKMKKIIITQSILWAAAIITIALVAPSESGWLLLTVLATIALGTLKKGIEPIQT